MWSIEAVEGGEDPTDKNCRAVVWRAQMWQETNRTERSFTNTHNKWTKWDIKRNVQKIEDEEKNIGE